MIRSCITLLLLSCGVTLQAQLTELARVVDSAGGITTNTRFQNISAIGEGGPVGFTRSPTAIIHSGFLQSFVAIAPSNQPAVVVRAPFSGIDIPLVDILGYNTAGPNGGPLQIFNVNAPVSGMASIVITNGVLRYTPDPGFSGSDLIQYRITDAGGIAATGVLHIQISSQPDQVPAIAIRSTEILFPAGLGVRSVGVPGLIYRFQESPFLDDVGVPIWQDIGSALCENTGFVALEFTPGSTPAFYRVVYP